LILEKKSSEGGHRAARDFLGVFFFYLIHGNKV
jgi:hypothetical protein